MLQGPSHGTTMAQAEGKLLGASATPSCQAWKLSLSLPAAATALTLFSSWKVLFIPDLLIFILSTSLLTAQQLGKNRSSTKQSDISLWVTPPSQRSHQSSQLLRLVPAEFVLMFLLQMFLAAPTGVIPYLTGVLIRRLNTWQVLLIQSMVCTKNTYLYALLPKIEQLIL